MNIRQTIITATVALTAVALIAPVSAGAITIAELQAQINLLMGQLAQLQGSTTVTTGTMPAACVGITFSRNLTVGSTGSDVKCLQVILNMSASTQVSLSGAGAPGMETTTFGPKTLVAVQKFQAANGITPASQVGPMTRAKLNAWLAGSTTGNPNNPPVVIPTGAGLTVMLASDNPAAGTLVSGSGTNVQGGADLAHFTFVNGDNATVKVTGLKLTRTGVSQDSLLANIYLYNGANRLTDAASVSSGIITFNDPTGLFTVPAGSSVTIRVLADLSAGLSGQTVGVSLMASDVTSNASSVKGTASSNLMTTASATLASVDWGTATPSSDGYVDPQSDYVIWQATGTVTTRAVLLSRFTLRQTGSINSGDVTNYRLYVDGVMVGSAVAGPDANGYVTFDLSANPKRLETGARVVKVLADIVSGSSQTFIYSLRTGSDAAFWDTQLNVGLVSTVSSSTFTQRKTGTETINSGTLTFTKTSDSATGNAVLLAPNYSLGKWTLKAAGEPVKVTDLYVRVTSSDTATTNFRNGALYLNGVQIGSTTDIVSNSGSGYSSGTHFSLGSSLVVDPKSPATLEVRADIAENAGTNHVTDGDTFYATIMAGSSNAEGTVSKSVISTPAAVNNGNTLTAKQGSVTLAQYTAYTSHTVVAPVTQKKLAHFTLSADTTENINVTSIQVDLNGVSSYTTNLYVTFGNNTTTTKATVSSSNTYSVNYSVTAGQTVDIGVYGDVSSSMTSGTGVATVTVSYTTASSAASTSTSPIGGQTITFGSGSLTPTFANIPSNNQIVTGGQTVLAGTYKFTAANDSFTVTEVKVKVPSISSTANSGIIQSAILKDASTGTQYSAPFDTTGTNANDTAYFKGMTVMVPANTTKNLEVWYVLSTPVADYSTDQLKVTPTLSYVKALNSQGAIKQTSDSTITIGTAAGNATSVFKTIPTFAKLAINASSASSGSIAEIYKFSVTPDAKGTPALKQLKFNVLLTHGGASSAPVANTFQLWRDGQDISTSLSGVTIQNTAGTSLEGTSTSVSAAAGAQTVIVTFNTEEIVATPHTYSLKAKLSSFLPSTSGNDSVAVSMLQDTAVNGDATAKVYDYNSGTGSIHQLATDAAGTSATDYNTIWSDQSAISHSDDETGTPTNDWINGYLVPGIGTDTSTVTAQ